MVFKLEKLKSEKNENGKWNRKKEKGIDGEKIGIVFYYFNNSFCSTLYSFFPNDVMWSLDSGKWTEKKFPASLSLSIVKRQTKLYRLNFYFYFYFCRLIKCWSMAVVFFFFFFHSIHLRWWWWWWWSWKEVIQLHINK